MKKSSKKTQVLIVDNDMTSEMIKEIVKGLGIEVVEAEDSYEELFNKEFKVANETMFDSEDKFKRKKFSKISNKNKSYLRNNHLRR